MIHRALNDRNAASTYNLRQIMPINDDRENIACLRHSAQERRVPFLRRLGLSVPPKGSTCSGGNVEAIPLRDDGRSEERRNEIIRCHTSTLVNYI